MTVPWLVTLLAVARADDDAPVQGDDAAPAEGTAAEGTAAEGTAAEGTAAESAGDGGWIDLQVEADFGSALDRVDEAAAETPAKDDLHIEDLVPLSVPRARLRGRWFVRPRLSAKGLVEGDWTMTAGAIAGHQWWSLREGGVRSVGETQVVVAAPLSARGHEVSLASTHGAWFGPHVGLLAGPAARWDRLEWDGTGLATAVTIGPQARLAVGLGRLTPWVSATPAWVAWGDRPHRTPWDELDLGAGIEIAGNPFTLRLSGSWRDTAAGDQWEAVAGIHLRLL